MDFFGIGAAVQGCAFSYFLASRATGRTTFLVENIQDGDVIVFADMREAKRVQILLQDRDPALAKSVRFLAHEPTVSLDELYARLGGRSPAHNRLIFDHTWLERFYLNQLEQLNRRVDAFIRDMSDNPKATQPTYLAAKEASKFPL